MDKNNKENRGLSQTEIDEIIDKIIEQAPVKEIKEHLIKYEREYRRKRDQGQLTNVIREIDKNLAEELLEKINKDEEEDSMRFGQALVDYWYEGVAKGAKENQIKVIKRMLKDNLTIELIKKYSGATDEEIEQARAEK